MKCKKTLLAGVLLTQSILFCADKDDKGVTPRTQKKRDELVKRWGPDLVEQLTGQDARNAIDFLNDLDLDAATPRIPDISNAQHDSLSTEYNTLSTPKNPVEPIPPLASKPFSIAERTPHIAMGETGSLEPYKKLVPPPSNSQKKPKPTTPPQTPISDSPTVSEKQPLIKKQSTTMIALGACATVIVLAALVYFLKNPIRIAKLS